MFKTFDNVLPDHIRQGALAVFPDEHWEWWHRYGNGKLATKDPCRVPAECRMALEELAKKCCPDEGFFDLSLVGAGLHLMPEGSELGEHRDAEYAAHRPWRRTGSLVYFLEYGNGGELVVDGDVIPAEQNQAVYFPGNQLHYVRRTFQPRRTLSLFSYVVDHSKKTTTAAVFT